MTREDVKLLLKIIGTAYPHVWDGKSTKDKLATIDLWTDMLAGEDPQLVGIALKRYIRSSHFPPALSDIYDELERMTGTTDESLYQEAWAAICGNIRFDELHPVNRSYFGSQHYIDQLGRSEDTVEGVFHGQYVRRIGQIRKRLEAKEDILKVLGPERAEAIASGTLKIGGGSHEER